MGRRWVTTAVFFLILLVAAVLRWTGLDWDDYHHFHPDERYILWVATTIEWPADWRTAFDPQRATFNPYYWPAGTSGASILSPQDEPRRFAYGHLPLYLAVAATRLAEALPAHWLPADWPVTRDILNGAGMAEFWHITAVARALTGLFDLGTIVFVFLLGRRLGGTAVGLLAASFLALNVMHIQLAHFFTVDPYLTFFVTGTMFWISDFGFRISDYRSNRSPAPLLPRSPAHYRSFLLAALFAGLAVGAKFTAVLLFLPLAVVAWLVARERWWRWWGTAVVVAFLAFFLTNPFAVLDWSCEVITPATAVGPLTIPEINWSSCYLDNITAQSAMVGGGGDVPFTRQYAGTRPYLYPLEMQLKWGMGWPLGVVALAGLGWLAWGLLKRLEIGDWRLERPANRQSLISNLLLLTWFVPFFLLTGGFYVKFMRYMQPLTPFLMVLAAALVWRLGRRWRWVVAGGVWVSTAVYALAFIAIYRVPHPWITASEWIYAHVEPGALILSERWDDALPIVLADESGQMRRPEQYDSADLSWLAGTGEGDDAAKLAANLDLLAAADYVALASNRVYGVTPRLPEQYPLSGQYHQLLFDGSLGYELAWVNGRYPHLGPVYYRPDTFGWAGLAAPTAVDDYLAETMPGLNGGRVDESFVVYDQPLVLIFRNVGRLSAGEMGALFAGPKP